MISDQYTGKRRMKEQAWRMCVGSIAGVSVLIGRIGGRKIFFALVVCGWGTCFGELAITLTLFARCFFVDRVLAAASPYTFKECQGESRLTLQQLPMDQFVRSGIYPKENRVYALFTEACQVAYSM